jgi:hypothetical protein
MIGGRADYHFIGIRGSLDTRGKVGRLAQRQDFTFVGAADFTDDD